MSERRLRRALVALLLAAVIALATRFAQRQDTGATPAVPPGHAASVPSPAPPASGTDPVLAAFRARQSDVQVETAATVMRVLKDDNKGSRHERFLIRVADTLTVLVAHNIDLAPNVPLLAGDSVRLRGEYEWDERGGVIHWTHRDPRGRHAGGWIMHEGRRYD
jgi:hypothetical protein